MYALSPIRVNLLFKPKFTVVKEVQPGNILSMLVNWLFSPNATVVKEVQSMNAPLPILVTLLAIEIFSMYYNAKTFPAREM